MYDGRLFEVCGWIGPERMIYLWEVDRVVEANWRKTPDAYLIFPTYDSSWDDQRIRPMGGDPKWIPIGATNSRNNDLIDLNPGPAGRHG